MKKSENAFASWFEHEEGTFFIPDDSLCPGIAKHFGVKVENFRDVAWYMKNAFLAFWSESQMEEHGLKIVTSKPTRNKEYIEIVEPDGNVIRLAAGKPVSNSGGWLKLRSVDGWLSKPHLNIMLERGLRIFNSKGTPNTVPMNPFGILTKLRGRRYISRFVLPDATILPQLYADLGVKSFEDFEFSQGELESLYELCIADNNEVEESDTGPESNFFDVLWESELPDGSICSALEIVQDWDGVFVVFVDTVLPHFRKRLAVIAETHRNAQGMNVSKDVFSRITSGTLYEDLIRLCNTDREMNRKCNADDYAIFRRALFTEFGFKWETTNEPLSPTKRTPGLYGFQNPRELYKQMHTGFFYIHYVEDELYPSYIKDNWTLYEPGEGEADPRNLFIVPGPSDPPLPKPRPNPANTSDFGQLIIMINDSDPHSYSFVFDPETGDLFGAGELMDVLAEKSRSTPQDFADELNKHRDEISEVPISYHSEVLAKHLPWMSDFTLHNVPLKGGHY